MSKEINLTFEHTDVFTRNLESNSRFVINRGGTGSSKSFSLVQLFTLKLLTEHNKRILVLRKTLPSLKETTYQMFKDFWYDTGLDGVIKESKQDLKYSFNDGYIKFSSLDDPQKMKSSSWNYIWLEEATDFTYDDFKTLSLYCRRISVDRVKNQIFLSFNPIDQYHWIKEKLINSYKDYTEIHSTYKNNPFLDKYTVEYIKNLELQDYNFYRIYTLGEWGKLEHIIYSNITIVDKWINENDALDIVYGLDFGFNVETALVKSIFLNENEIYEKSLLYETKLTNKQLIEKMDFLGVDKTRKIYCDSQEPNRIEELNAAGYFAFPAVKAIKDGIDYCKTLRIHILDDDVDLKHEYNNYSYRTDKNGNVYDDPVKFKDHLMDASRYSKYTRYKELVLGTGAKVDRTKKMLDLIIKPGETTGLDIYNQIKKGNLGL